MSERLKIDRPIIVEGKYDKITLSSVLDATIIPTGGFSLFHQKEKMALIRRLARERGVIVLTDSDGAGKLIRAHLSSSLPKESVIHLYTPSIEGKERRKKTPSKEGLLGVEGMEAARLRRLFAPFATNGCPQRPSSRRVEKHDLYADGLSGGAGAAARREALAALLALPRGLSANALLEALNHLISYDEYRAALDRLTTGAGAACPCEGGASPLEAGCQRAPREQKGPESTGNEDAQAPERSGRSPKGDKA